MKRTTAALLIALAFPLAASALTIADIQAQFQSLVQKFNTTTAATVSSSAGASTNIRPCPQIVRVLGIGSRGSDVSDLQAYLGVSPTGYFGPLTARAVASFQANEGLSAAGIVGPQTRAAFGRRCGNPAQPLSATPQSGGVPLTVEFTTSVGVTEAAPTIDFGDGQNTTMTKGSCIGITAIRGGQGGIRCSYNASHTYTTTGTYVAKTSNGGTATIRAGDQINQSGTFNASQTSGNAPLTVDFTYTPPSDDNAQYYITFGDGAAQIMDRTQIYCIRARCISPSKATHTYTQNGTYTATVTRYIACLYTNPRCMIATMLLGQITITVGPSTSHSAPSISAFSGPTTLEVGATGTWTIQASDPQNQPLSYHVTWGDEHIYAPAASMSAGADAFVQTTTFTHAYSESGTYTVTVAVRDSAGFEARASSTVRVGSSGTVCTMDAMLCPDGTYVGRTGPNCQFVCPTH